VARRSTGRHWAARGAGALLASTLVVPLAVSGAHAHPGHTPEVEPAQAEEPADPALDWDNYEKITLTKDTGEPIDLAVLPDSRVLHTARDGVVRLTDPATGQTREVGELDVYANSEDGLQGIAIDPDFEENQWVYLVYAPRVMSGVSPTGVPYPETTPSGQAPETLPEGEDLSYWDQWLGYNVLSRFKWDEETDTLDLASEQQIIKVDAQRGQCCHVGADMAWDGEGNLYLSTGDNTPAGTPGAAGYTPINNAPGMNPGFDARRGAGNTNDLRGAILRINVLDEIEEGAEPGPGSTYTIPEGNLFDSEEYAGDEDKVREEIYAMGLRNPFRIDYDIESGALFWGDYGPDAGSAHPERGPMGYVEWQLTTEPINGGWPYCHGPNDEPYNEWDYATGEPGEWFDCDAGPVNNSTWNTGLEQLPPVTQPQIWYGDNPGDQPWDELVTFAERGGQAPMGGPIYRYDEENDSPRKFPAFWDGKPFMGEFSQDYVAVFELDELSSDGEVTAIHNFLPNAALYEAAAPEWSGIMDMEFGPDGSLYVLEYGKGFFRQNPEAGLYRIDYNEENKTPRAAFTADPISGSEAPLEVSFDASASFDPEGDDLTYEWDFDGDGEVDAEGVTVTHTYEELGQFTAILRATDPQGLFGLATREITVGNTAPEISLNIDDGAIFDWGDSFDVSVSVSDAEDGDEPVCERVRWTFGLGHDEHAHPEVSGTGCEFTIETRESAREHGEGEKIFGTLVVSYTDEEQGDVPAVTGETTLILKPEVQQAEWFDAADGVTVVDDADAGAGAYVTDFDEGDSLTFSPMAFTHAPTGNMIDTVTARGAGEGTVSLTWAGEDAAFAELEFTGGDGWTDVTTELTDVPAGSGAVVVTSTGGVDLDSLTFLESGQAWPTLIEPERVSIGMFSLIPWVDQDGVRPVLTRLAEIGFENIEPFGGTLNPYTAREFRAMADTLGLSVPSSHYNVDEDSFDETLAYVDTLGQEYVGSGGFAAPGIGSYEDTLATAETMNRLGERSVEAGIGKFFGHNHAGEFTTVYEHNGEEMSAWEILVEETDPEYVTFQVDVAWAVHGGVDVVELIEEHGDRIELLHIKDATNLGGSGSPSWQNLGEGDVPLPEILAAAEEHADIAYYVLEYDVAPEGEEFARTGFEYLTGQEAGEFEPIHVKPEEVSVGMFSLTPWVGQDGLPSVFARLAEIGLQNVEPFGSNFSGWTAEEFRAMTELIGLDVPSSHYNVDEDTFAETLEYVETLGQEYVGSGGFADPGISTYGRVLQTAQTMNRLGEASVEAGIGKFFGHNHAGEFTTVYNHGGQELSAWEILVQETDAEYVTFQLDVAWAAHAGIDVPALIEQYGDRIELLHIKDATNLGGSGSPQWTNLGEGDVDLQGILAAAREHADIALYVMEYDRAPEGEEFVRTGFEYLTGQEAGEVGSRVLEVTPQAVTFADEAGTEEDTYTVPRTVGVEYLVDGQVVTAGTHEAEGTVTVTARAAAGFELAEGSTTEWSHTFSTETPDTRTAEFHLTNGWDASTDVHFMYGRWVDEVFIGDWDGDGVDTIAVRRGNEFHVTNTLEGGDADVVFRYGRTGDVILVGDWDGDGRDSFAVRRGASYHINNSLRGGDADAVVTYGRSDDDVLVGDWDGDGVDTFAVRRGATYHVKNSLRGGDADTVFTYGRGDDVVLVGDWDGDGRDTLAVRRGATYHVNNSLRGGDADTVVTFGRAGDQVYVGDWDRDGADTLGVRRPVGSAPSAATGGKEIGTLAKTS